MRLLESAFECRISSRGSQLLIEGDDESKVRLVEGLLLEFCSLVEEGEAPSKRDLRHAFELIAEGAATSLKEFFPKSVVLKTPVREVVPRTPNQVRYVRMIEAHDLVFAIGPAGTGKTYLAVAVAISCLLKKRVQRIILARPAVEAGERLGFLPGDLQEKINPYLRPLHDALHNMLSGERVQKLTERGTIEIAPLAFMRGRTLSDAFIILDEAQNCTPQQMKMFLTRIGVNSKAVVTGDITQIDLPRGERSGLVDSTEVLAKVSGVAFCGFTQQDVVRHPLVKAIIQAYESRKGRRSSRSEQSGSRSKPEG